MRTETRIKETVLQDFEFYLVFFAFVVVLARQHAKKSLLGVDKALQQKSSTVNEIGRVNIKDERKPSIVFAIDNICVFFFEPFHHFSGKRIIPRRIPFKSSQ